MVEISNIPEKFFREIRQIEIFNAKEYSFTANSTGKTLFPRTLTGLSKENSKTETLFSKLIYHLISMVSTQ